MAVRAAQKATVGGPVPADEAVGYDEAIRAFGDVAEALGGEHSLDELLHLVATRICELLGLKRCSVYLRDADTGLFRGQVGHADRNIDPQIKRLIAGVEADRFTQEILQTQAPVLLRDALADPRPIRSTMRAWNVRAMLGVPMLLHGEVSGILFLDNEDVPHPFTRAQQGLAATFANLAAIAIGQAQLTTRLRATILTAARQNRLLRQSAEIDERLTQLILDGANLREIACAVAELTGKPCAVADQGFRCRATAGPAVLDIGPLQSLLEGRWADAPSVRAALAGADGRTVVAGPAVSEGLNHRLIMAPVLTRGDCWGYLVMVEYGSRIGPLDRVVADRAATIIALELSAERRAAAAENDALESLGADLIRGVRDDDALERRADFLGVRLASPHVLCLIAGPTSDEDSTPTARRVMQALQPAAPGLRLYATSVAEGIVAIVELPDDLPGSAAVERGKATVSAACRRLAPGGSLWVSVSSICRRPGDYVRAYAEVCQVMRCVDAFCPPGSLRVLAADDLGIGRLLLSAADREATDRFVEDVLGPLIEGRDERGADLLGTLQTFFACSRSVRRSARQLRVHENTIRYRLARIEEIIGLAVTGDADAQLTAQLALLVLRLEGRLPDQGGPRG